MRRVGNGEGALVQPDEGAQLGRELEPAVQPREKRRRREDHACTGVRGNARHSRVGAARIGRIRRHRDRARVQAAEERRHVVESRRDEKQHAVARDDVLGQPHRDRLRPLGKAVVRECGLFTTVAAEKAERRAAGVSRGAVLQQLDERSNARGACIVPQEFLSSHPLRSSAGPVDAARLRAASQPSARYQR